MHDHAVTAKDLLGGIIVTGGKDGGYEENVCGLDSRLRIWRVDGTGGEDGDQVVKDIGVPALMTWDLAAVGNQVVVSLCKRGRATVEVWELEERENMKK